MGTDITSVDRIGRLLDRYGDRFLHRIFSPAEIDGARNRHDRAAFFAARWAAREAFLKSLRRDVRLIPYKDIEIVKEAAGPVSIRLHGRAHETFAQTGASAIHLSISHEKEYAVATVILEI